MKHYGDPECHYFVENGIVWFTERGSARVVAKFDSDIKAEAYLDRLSRTEKVTKKKTRKTSGKYEQKKSKHHKQ